MTTTLVLIEHEARRVKPASLRALSAARQLSGTCELLVVGHQLESVVESLLTLGASTIHVADHESLVHPLADRYAAVVAGMARQIQATTLIGAASAFAKDILPRVAGLLDAPMLSDVVAIAHEGGDYVYVRPVFAGSSLAKVTLRGELRLLTIRAAAFEPPTATGQLARVTPVAFDPTRLPQGTMFLSKETRPASRPELTDARVVVAGGRPLKDRESFDRLVTTLADVLGGAVGATRAAVDAGIAPNDLQIGQTGKVIAADLYVALGISGAIQHLAGIKDARVIVAVNKDPDAPIHGLATYSLVGDLFQVGPQLIDKLQQRLSFRES